MGQVTEINKYQVKNNEGLGTIDALVWTGKNVEPVADLIQNGATVKILSDQMLVVNREGREIFIPVGAWLIALGDGEFATCSGLEFISMYEEAADGPAPG